VTKSFSGIPKIRFSKKVWEFFPNNQNLPFYSGNRRKCAQNVLTFNMTPNTELEPLATIDDVCTWLQKSKPLVKKLAREGRIPAIKIGKS
jgi:hypothetical protein